MPCIIINECGVGRPFMFVCLDGKLPWNWLDVGALLKTLKLPLQRTHTHACELWLGDLRVLTNWMLHDLGVNRQKGTQKRP